MKAAWVATGMNYMVKFINCTGKVSRALGLRLEMVKHDLVLNRDHSCGTVKTADTPGNDLFLSFLICLVWKYRKQAATVATLSLIGFNALKNTAMHLTVETSQ